jgi:predicted nucleotidyltransferase component of viral defense system
VIIKTSRQLKDKVSNLSGNDSKKAQTLIRKYMMERFLARISHSKYKNNFILKGGMLVSALVGVESRATMDIDTTVRMLPLTKDNAIEVIAEIMKIDLDDDIFYEIKKVEDIMEEHDYSGVRFTISVTLEKLRDTIKIDISTGDEITPSAIEFSYPMMFDDERINIWSYNLETMLAEKLETVIARSTFNTRMRDFYDIHILWSEKANMINIETLRRAIINVARKRETLELFDTMDEILDDIVESDYLRNNWSNYRKGSYYVGDLEWSDVLETTVNILKNEIGSLSVKT